MKEVKSLTRNEVPEVENMIKEVEKAKEAKKAEINGLVALITNSKKVELTDEQAAACKAAMVTICQKFVTGGKITADENTIMQYVASLTKKAVHAGQTEVEKAEAKVQAEKTFAADLQKYEIDLAVRFTEWSENVCTRITNEEDEKWNFVKISKDTLKTSFAAFLKALPVEPKKPGAKSSTSGSSSNNGTTSEKKHLTDVSKLSEGTKLTVWNAIVGADNGITKEEIEKIVIAAFPEKSIELNKSNVYKALYYLPEIIVDGKYFAKVAEEAAK